MAHQASPSADRDRTKKIMALVPQVESIVPTQLTDQAERICRMTSVAVAMSPQLRACDIGTILQASAQAASLGLDVGGVTGLAYMVPFKGKAQLQIGYKGYIELAHRANIRLWGRVVYQGDFFEVMYGDEDTIIHKPKRLSGKFGEITYAYAIAKFADGSTMRDVLDRTLIDQAQESSQATYDGRPWEKHYDEMARKTAVRRLGKYLPKVPELIGANELNNRGDTGGATGHVPIIDEVGDFEAIEGIAEVIDDGDPRTEETRAEDLLAEATEKLTGASHARDVNQVVAWAVKQPGSQRILEQLTTMCDTRKEQLRTES